jgi:outer membrane protein, multidrug efflux system
MRTSLFLLGLAVASSVFAQGPKSGAARVVAAPSEPAPGAASAPEDPTLAPVAMPSRRLEAWPDVLRLVRERSADLARARARVGQAKGQVRTAWAGVLPTLQGSAAGVHNFVTNSVPLARLDANGNPIVRILEQPTKDFAQASLQVAWPLASAPAYYQIETAKLQAESASLGEEDAQRLVLTSVAQSILAVVTAERVSELNRIGVRSAAERLALVRYKSDMGAANGLDVLRIEQDVEAARATLVTGDEQLRQAREALGLALGLEEAVGVDPALRIEGLEAAASAVCRSGDLASRPDLAAARADERIAERGATAVKLQWLPTLAAQSQVATTTLEQITFPKTTWNVQAVVSWSLWDGGARYGQEASAIAATASARASRELLERQAKIQVDQAERSVAVAEASLEVARKSHALATELEGLTTRSLDEGRGSSLEVVTAAAARRQAEITLALREFDVARARLTARLARAVCNY